MSAGWLGEMRSAIVARVRDRNRMEVADDLGHRLSGGRARVPSRRGLTVWPTMPGAGFLALRVLADVAEESGNRVRA